MHSINPGATVAANSATADELYKARLAELDNAIAELLDGEPMREPDTLRRSESERRGSDNLETDRAVAIAQHPVRRTRSERRSGVQRHPRNP